MLQVQENQYFNNWKVLEPNIINPDTKNKNYIGKPIFSKCICTKCNITIKLISNYDLTGPRCSKCCQRCNLIERNTKNAEVQIGKTFNNLKVIGDAGFKIRNDGKRRHFSLCECLLCGNTVEVMDNSLQTGNTTSCGCVNSKGEMRIKEILNQNNIIYNYDSIFPQLALETKRNLRFDFIIYKEDGEIDRFVEFDGNQHKTGMWGGSWHNLEPLEKIQERDEIKNNFCLKHNYTLIRIPYSILNNMTLEDIMTDKYKIKEEM